MLAKPKSLAHVEYRTRRFKEMLDWYRKVFDVKVQLQDEACAFLTFDKEHHRFAISDMNVIRPDQDDKDDRGMIGIDHIAWEYESLRDILENYAVLKEQGIEPYWAVNHGMSASLYYADPDGNQMEFTVDCFSSKKECSDYFKSDQCGANPIGVEYDPDEWLAKLRDGASESELLKIDSNGEASPIRGSMMELG